MTDSVSVADKKGRQKASSVFQGEKFKLAGSRIICNSLQLITLRLFPILHQRPPIWPVTCTSSVNALATNISQVKLKEIYEEAKGFLSYRIADRRGDHFDHRGHRNSELAPFQARGE